MNSYYGWNGKVLRVNLSSGCVETVYPPPELYHKFIGGKGLAGHYLRPWVTLPWDHPDMPVLIFSGPLVGTAAPTSGRSAIVSRSPLTGAVADSSVGGRLGFHLKRAGWDGIIITGKAVSPCGIRIEDATVKIVDASELWGKDIEHCFDILGDSNRSVVLTGPAGENGVAFAALMVDKHHSAGRAGIGSCCGAKNLKFLSIQGSNKVAVKDKAALKESREEILRLTSASPVLMGQNGFSCFGTGSIYDLMDSRRMMPTDNFTKTRFDKAGELNAHAYKDTYKTKKHGCMGCHIRCKKIATGGGRKGSSMPEFETMSHFTALVGNTDMEIVMEANKLCNSLGMDTISAAATLACYREISGQENLSDSILELLKQIGTGATPLGRVLGKGSLAYATANDKVHTSMQVKGLELPAYDPRGAYGMSLAYALSTRGGCHLRAYPISHEILRKPVATDRFSYAGKARTTKIAEDQNAVIDSLTACKFIFFAAGLEEYAKAYTAVTGIPTSAQELLKRGEVIYYQERIMNHLNGFGCEDDDLPQRFFKEPGSSGHGITIKPLDRRSFLEARAKYYRIRGLDDQGHPLAEKAAELGLAWTDS